MQHLQIVHPKRSLSLQILRCLHRRLRSPLSLDVKMHWQEESHLLLHLCRVNTCGFFLFLLSDLSADARSQPEKKLIFFIKIMINSEENHSLPANFWWTDSLFKRFFIIYLLLILLISSISSFSLAMGSRKKTSLAKHNKNSIFLMILRIIFYFSFSYLGFLDFSFFSPCII